MSYPYYYRLAADYIADEQQEKAFRSSLIGVIDSLIENAVLGEQRLAIRYLFTFAGPVGTADDVVETISIYRDGGDVYIQGTKLMVTSPGVVWCRSGRREAAIVDLRVGFGLRH